MPKKTIRLYDPEAEVLHPDPLTIEDGGGFMTWTPQQWLVFLGGLAAFIATVVNLVTGNPVGIPFAG